MIGSRKNTMLRVLHVAGLGLAFALAVVPPASGTTYASTELSRFAAMSNAVVQGDVVSTTNLVDRNGVPWTIYNLAVAKVLAGTVSDKLIGFRCIGGTSGDRRLKLEGSPALTVGDSIVAFLHQEGACQVSGLEYGVFWKRTDALGVERITDFRGRVLAALGGDSPVLSGDVVAAKGSPDVPEAHDSSRDSEEEDPASLNAPPPAPADTILSELEAFSRAYVTKSVGQRSTVDLTGIPTFDQTRAPVDTNSEVQK